MFAFIRHHKKFFVAILIAASLIFTVQRARAFVDETGAYAAAIAAAGAGAGGIATAVGGTFLGLTPIGWLGIGVSVAAAFLLTGDTDTQKKVVISARTAADDPNPDLHVVPPAEPAVVTPYAPFLAGSSRPYLYFNYSTPLPDADYQRFFSRLQQYLATYNFRIEPTVGWGKYGSVADTYCPTGPCIYVQTITAPAAGVAVPYSTNSPGCPSISGLVCRKISDSTYTTPGTTALYIRVSPTTPSECSEGSTYDYFTGECISAPPDHPLEDGFCRISWNSQTGCPIYNSHDPDCVSSEILRSCGSATTPPTVTIKDPTSGKTVSMSRPFATSQGEPGSVTVKERIPDPASNTTVEKVTYTAPPTTPGSFPTNSGSGQSTYPGTGNQASSTPVQQVSIQNWPDSLSHMNSYLQQIASNTANIANSPNQNIQFPERMKIDGEIPPEYASLPTPPAQSDHKTFLDPLKTKLEGFFNFQFPTHVSSCPSIDIDWHAWNVDISVSSNFMCDFLEEHRAFFEGLMTFAFVAIAIIIVLGA